MRYRKDWALACSALALMLSVAARADITSYRLGDGTGEDWEPAIVADGSYVYALWPHFFTTTYKDSSGATCMGFSTRGGGKNNTETVNDGAGNFYGIWAEGESYLGSGDVYYSKF